MSATLPIEAEFRAEANAFLAAHCKPRESESARKWGEGSDKVSVFEEKSKEAEARDVANAKAWRGEMFKAGFAWITGPTQYGGRGLPGTYQRMYDEEASNFSTPNLGMFQIGLGMVAPTILAHASDTAKATYLEKMWSGDIVGCQLFSEPGAGSDVAGLATKAIKDGEEWIVNGQKVWTTLAHLSRWGMLVARSDANAEKHKGLTYFVVDMHAPTVEVRPLRQMTGDAEFNEVYFTDTRIPDAERLGEVGDGWRVSLTTLMNERVSIGGAIAPRGSGPIGIALKAYKDHGHTDPATRDRLMQLWVRAEAARLTNLRASANRKAGTPGPEGSTGKLNSAELNKDIYDFCINLIGANGMLYADYTMRRPETAMAGSTVQEQFLRSRANSIEGGTSEVMRNILGERVLGLPGDVRVDKGKSWLEVPRN